MGTFRGRRNFGPKFSRVENFIGCRNSAPVSSGAGVGSGRVGLARAKYFILACCHENLRKFPYLFLDEFSPLVVPGTRFVFLVVDNADVFGEYERIKNEEKNDSRSGNKARKIPTRGLEEEKF